MKDTLESDRERRKYFEWTKRIVHDYQKLAGKYESLHKSSAGILPPAQMEQDERKLLHYRSRLQDFFETRDMLLEQEIRRILSRVKKIADYPAEMIREDSLFMETYLEEIDIKTQQNLTDYYEVLLEHPDPHLQELGRARLNIQ